MEKHIITAFKEPIVDLPTEPQLAPAELKRRFQSPSDELREAHNALAREVNGITGATYPDTVTREMLTPDIRQEIAAKAAQTDLAAEAAARTAADTAMSTAVARKCELFFGSYTGTGTGKTQAVKLGFRPKAVLVATHSARGNYFNPQYMNLIFDGGTAPNVRITDTGFEVFSYSNCAPDDESSANPYRYIAFK